VTTPVISVYNQAVTPLGLDLNALIPALQQYIGLLAEPWGVAATLQATSGPVVDTWTLAFLDDSDSEGALAYHEALSGMPIAKVFVHTDLQAGSSLSVSASHELVEMLCDPACNLTATDTNGIVYAFEAADAVESTTFKLAGFDVSDFVLPAYFDPHTPSGAQIDYCKVLSAPFSLAPGGYASICQGGNWSEIFGSREKAALFAKEDRRGHRSEYRRRVTSRSTNAIVAAMQNV
jgi:hypothetical protein